MIAFAERTKLTSLSSFTFGQTCGREVSSCAYRAHQAEMGRTQFSCVSNYVGASSENSMAFETSLMLQRVLRS